jgi:hypothetical protein
MRELHAGAEWDLLEVRYLRIDNWVQLSMPTLLLAYPDLILGCRRRIAVRHK